MMKYLPLKVEWGGDLVLVRVLGGKDADPHQDRHHAPASAIQPTPVLRKGTPCHFNLDGVLRRSRPVYISLGSRWTSHHPNEQMDEPSQVTKQNYGWGSSVTFVFPGGRLRRALRAAMRCCMADCARTSATGSGCGVNPPISCCKRA